MSIFDSKTPTAAQEKAMKLGKSAFEGLLELAETIQPGRYRSVFVTDLEKLAMMFNKAVCHDGIKDDPDRSSAS